MAVLTTFLRFVTAGLAWVVLFIGTLWALGALWFDFPISSLRHALALMFGVGAVTLLLLRRYRWRARFALALAIILVMSWWLTLLPRRARDWKPEVAVPANAIIDGERVTIEGVRNFEYRSETDFTPHYDTRTYPLSQLRGVDLFVTYWGSALIAHPILSFDFGDGGRICFSIETRSERGESYSAIRGFYRQYELIYLAADERDVVRLRTSFRKGEDVYLYRLNLPEDETRARFLEYARRIKELHARPEWYNAVTTNCTTSIRSQHTAGNRAPWDWRILANGKADEMLYERGVLDRTLAFADLKRRAHINEPAMAAGDAPDFSERIRSGSPPP